MRFEPSHIHQQTPREPSPCNTANSPKPNKAAAGHTTKPAPDSSTTTPTARPAGGAANPCTKTPNSTGTNEPCMQTTREHSVNTAHTTTSQTGSYTQRVTNKEATAPETTNAPPTNPPHPPSPGNPLIRHSLQLHSKPPQNLKDVGFPRPLASRAFACLSLVLFSSNSSVQGVEYVAC